jgi:hypothetical protein
MWKRNKTLVGKPEGRRPLRKPRCRWKDIKIYHIEIRCEDVYWIHLAQDRVHWREFSNTVTDDWVSEIAGTFLISLATNLLLKKENIWSKL